MKQRSVQGRTCGPSRACALIRELRGEREHLKVGVAEVARVTGYRENQIGNWERGETEPGLYKFIDVANALGFDVVLKRKGKLTACGTTRSVTDTLKTVKRKSQHDHQFQSLP